MTKITSPPLSLFDILGGWVMWNWTPELGWHRRVWVSNRCECCGRMPLL